MPIPIAPSAVGAAVRIAFVTTGLAPGGAETMLFKLLKTIDRRRFDCAVFSLRGEGDALVEPLRAMGVPVFTAGFGSVPAWRAVAALRRAAMRFDPDLLQGWMPHGNLFASVLAALLRPRRARRVWWGIRQAMPDFTTQKPATAVLIRASAMLSRRTDAIIYNSHQGAADHEALGYAASRRVVLPNGFDTTAFSPSAALRAEVRRELQVDDATVLVGSFARYHPVKDHAGLIAAAALIAAQRPDVRFVFAGSDVDEDNVALTTLRRKHGLEGRLMLLGERSDMTRLNAALDIAVCASLAEGFPNVVGEAMACGVPVVVTDVGDCASIVGDTGLVVPSRNPQALATALLRLHDAGAAEREARGGAARRRVEQLYSIGAVVRTYETLVTSPSGREKSACAD